MSNAPTIITLGCRLNIAESQAMRDHARAAGVENLVIVNTCAVTNEAVRQARQSIRKARKAEPDARLIVTGCAAQIAPEDFAAMPEVDAVLGNREKLIAESWAALSARDFGASDTEKIQVDDIMSVRDTAGHLINGYDGRARAFVQVQNGCDHRCTFCIIPYGRGNSRSVPVGEAVRQIEDLVDQGYNEIVLTGVDITSYGAGLPGTPSLGRLVDKILDRIPRLLRLRLSSLDSVEIDEALFARITEDERVAPHLHLSLQAGDNLILKRMKRRHSREDAIELCDRIRARREDVAFGADLIAGFPTETEEMFQNTLRLVEDCGLAYLHVFPFSPREGTPAARMPQLDRAVVKERAARLREKGAAALSAHLDSMVDHTQNALIENNGRARAANFAEIELENPAAAEPGALAQVDILGRTETRLRGRIVLKRDGGGA